MSIALTERQFLILCRVQERNVLRDGAETGREMAEALWHTGEFTSYEQGQRSCKQLVKKGLLCELGVAAFGARCYGLDGRDEPRSPTTPQGRQGND